MPQLTVPRDLRRAPLPVPVAADDDRRWGIDDTLALLAVVVSAVAIVILAGFPSGSGAGPAVRGAVLALFWLTAPGAAIALWLRLTPLTKVAMVPLLGLAVLTVLGTIGAWTGVWIPRPSGLAVAVLALLSGVAALARHRARPPRIQLRRPSVPTLLMLAGIAAALALWGVSIPGIPRSQPSSLGLIVSGPRTLPAALLILAVVFLCAARGARTGILATVALAFVVVLRTTASAAASVPTAVWTYKHIGVVNILLGHHHVLGGTDIYMNWPAMFGAGAYFSDAGGVPAIDVARWFPVMVHVVLALATAALARTLGARPAGSAAAAVLVVLLNWVGQDYYSPQALALCLAAGVVVLLVQSRASRTSAVLALVLFVVIVPMHQLTPFWLVGLAFLLMLLRRTPWWVVLGMAVVLAGYVASRWDVVSAYGIFTGFNVFKNAAGNVVPVPALGRDVAGLFAKATAVLMWLSTLGVLIFRASESGWRRALRSDGAVVPFVIAFSPFALLAAQNYGGEAALRVTLYSTLGCAAVLGPALVSAFRGSWLAVTATAVWGLVAAALVAQTSFSAWFVNYVRSEDLTAAAWLTDQHARATVIAVAADWPGRGWIDYDTYRKAGGADIALDTTLRRFASYAHRPVDGSLPLDLQRLQQVAGQVGNGNGIYVVFTGSMQAYDEYYATYTPGSYQALRRAMQLSPSWQVAIADGDLWVFRYAGRGAPPP